MNFKNYTSFNPTTYILLERLGNLKLGVRGSIKTLDLKFTLENQLTDESWEIDNRFNNFLIYKEDIYAAYAMYGNKHHNWS